MDEIHLNPNNRNRHSQEQIDRLAQIIRYQGFREPGTISLRSGFLCAGEGRYLAAKQIGMTHMPCILQDFDDEDQEYAYGVSTNSIASWAELDLSGINADLPELGPDFDIDLLGIKDFVLDPADKYGNGDADAVPETPKVAKSKRGELWLLGNHRVLCGDATSREDVGRLMGGEKADMAFTSPPYNLGISSKLTGNTKIAQMGNAYVGYDDAKTENEWLSLVSSATLNALNASRYAFINLQFLAGNRTAIVEYWHAFRDKICDVMVWDKGHAAPAAAERVLNSRFEFVFIFTSDENPNRAIRIAPVFRGTIDNVYQGSPQRQNESCDIHGATFPVAFPEWFLNNFCHVNGSALDPFSGCGSTLIACEKTGRRCFGMEIEPIYIDVILSRWAKFTGQDPVREDGVKWSELHGGSNA